MKVPAPKVKMPKVPTAKMATPKAPQFTGGLKGYAAASKLTLPKQPKSL